MCVWALGLSFGYGYSPSHPHTERHTQREENISSPPVKPENPITQAQNMTGPLRSTPSSRTWSMRGMGGRRYWICGGGG
jgi:hypothetical protein